MTNPPPARSPRTGPFVDRLFGWAAKGAALLTLSLLVAILGSLFVGAWPAIAKYGLGFLTSTTWDPVTEEYGGLVMIYGTLDDLAGSVGHCRSGQFWHCTVFDRAVAAPGSGAPSARCH
jgi:ABC-type phosphate transport system permease subunit